MSIKIGFLVNPIAGMGGKVGLKGTDGVVDKALSLGAKRIAPLRSIETLKEFNNKFSKNEQIKWITCSDDMGENELIDAGFKQYKIIYEAKNKETSSIDTKNACKRFLDESVELILFCGGDGTARDVFSSVKKKVPILGIPAGVKMHSAVFGINPNAVAKILFEYINKRLTVGDVEIMDLDEERYRKGEWNIKLFGIAKGIVEPTYVQVGKATFESVSDESIKDELTEHIEDEMNENQEYLYFFGSGGTIDYIANKLNLDNTLLGIDAIYKNEVVGSDLNEKEIIKLLEKYKKAKLLLSPIGAQGFILGRGNLQLSPKVVKKIGIDNLIIVSTPAKLKNTPLLRIDTGNEKLENLFAEKEFLMVVIGYRLSRVVKLQTNRF